ncbi:MAG TPA: hypothetical protein VHZ49_22540 [Methylomirabilota bacterium]|nr:hypothetical protein [Methylomirabilota bacterium]
MKTLRPIALGLVLLSGCATSGARPQASGNTYTGEVWTWDEQESTVTLRRGAQDLRVKVTPDQLRGLQLHQTATVRGELAPPMDIPRIITPAMAVRPVPKGPIDQQVVNGTVTATDPRGRVSVSSEHGPLQVWAAAGAEQRFQPGTKVRVDMSVQPVDMVPAGSGAPPAASDPAASPSPEPGDHAVVTGRIIGVEKTGTLIVESPTGPVQVWVPDSSKYRVEQPVQVRTVISAAP